MLWKLARGKLREERAVMATLAALIMLSVLLAGAGTGLITRLAGSGGGIDLAVAEGEFLAVTGSSGCGKSTLRHTLAGLEEPTHGTVLWAGEDHSTRTPRERSRHRLREIGIVFQQFHLLRTLCLLDNVLLPGLLARAEPRALLRERAAQLMTQLGVQQLAERGVGEASGGQLQRVAIARDLINQPRLLVADEPTGALDSAAGEEVMDALSAVSARGTTIVLVTHDHEVAGRADRIVTMADGRITGERRPRG